MRVQIEVILSRDNEGSVEQDEIYATLDMDVIPRMGEEMNLEGFGEVRVVNVYWQVDRDFPESPFVLVHIVTEMLTQ